MPAETDNCLLMANILLSSNYSIQGQIVDSQCNCINKCYTDPGMVSMHQGAELLTESLAILGWLQAAHAGEMLVHQVECTPGHVA